MQARQYRWKFIAYGEPRQILQREKEVSRKNLILFSGNKKGTNTSEMVQLLQQKKMIHFIKLS